MSLQLQAELQEVFAGGQTGVTSRWVAANFYNRVLLATPSVQPIYWEPGLEEVPVWKNCRPIPGLPDQTGYDGVEVFAGHVLLWRGYTIKGSGLNDFAQWIPVALTASTGRAVVAEDFTQPDTGETSPFVFLNDVSGSFTVGQFVRIVSNEDEASKTAYSYYTVDSVSSSSVSVDTINVDIGVPAVQRARVYTNGSIGWVVGSRIAIDGTTSSLEVSAASRSVSPTYTLDDDSTSVPSVGGTIQFPMTSFPSDLRAGDIVSVGINNSLGQDLYQVTVVGWTLVCVRLGVGEAQAAVGTTFPGDSQTVYVKFQPFVEATNRTDVSVSIPKGSTISPAEGLKLVSLGYSGSVSAGSLVVDGSVVETIDTNEATEIENVGSNVNGDIFAIVTLADYAYILKKESIQSIQYVGGTSPYAIRAEIFEEGPIGRYAWCRHQDRELIFWGHKGWMKYAGGQVVEQIGLAHWEAVNDELDRSRSDEIVAWHYRTRNEVWFAYPVLQGGTKVVIYNYESDSVVVDSYEASLNGITALGSIEWEVAPTWESLPDTEHFNCEVFGSGVPAGEVEDLPDKRWYEYVDEGLAERTIIGIGGTTGNADNGEDPAAVVPRLLCHGRVYHRASSDDCDPDPYTARAETPDFDFGDPQAVKYVDGVYLHLHVPVELGRPMKLNVQLGTRAGLDGNINWSEERPVEVSGNGNVVAYVRVRGAGRLVRLRFISDAENVQWEISRYLITGTAGEIY